MSEGHHVGIDEHALGPAAEITATVSEAPSENAPPLLEVTGLRTYWCGSSPPRFGTLANGGGGG